ncbi:MAG: chromate resistance protein ChrB domain-containing protein [Gemmatimonadaceae bacterium]
MVKSVSHTRSGRWLLLLPQLPAKPDYARVKLWRRLQPLGVIALRNAVYVLPNTPDAREDLEWIAKEVEGDGGTAVVCEATLLEGVSDEDLEVRFRERAAQGYQNIATRARAALGDPPSGAVSRRLRTQLEVEIKRDQFGGAGRPAAEQALAALEAASQPTLMGTSPDRRKKQAPSGAVWVTRAGVFVDRIASAWLIRRFIDRKAKFRFVTTTRYAPRRNELRFDMFQAEYTHRADRCTFEVLLEEFDLTNPALHAIAQIVHDIDLKDERFNRPETEGITQLLHGLALAEPNDSKRLRAGEQIFDSLFAQFSSVQP